MKAKLYYEAHVTIDPVTLPGVRSWLEDLCSRHKFKLAKLLMDKGVPSQLDTFMTGHGKDLTDLHDRLVALVREVQANDLRVRRYKIEDTILDSRCSDVLELLATEKP